MKTYQCHKRVQAAKITEIFGVDLASESQAPMQIWLGIGDGQHVVVTEAWIARHKPEVGGYFVKYEDGYTSFSPASAFESGYTQVEPSVDGQCLKEGA